MNLQGTRQRSPLRSPLQPLSQPNPLFAIHFSAWMAFITIVRSARFRVSNTTITGNRPVEAGGVIVDHRPFPRANDLLPVISPDCPTFSFIVYSVRAYLSGGTRGKSLPTLKLMKQVEQSKALFRTHFILLLRSVSLTCNLPYTSVRCLCVAT